jgi:hypothetical protein
MFFDALTHPPEHSPSLIKAVKDYNKMTKNCDKKLMTCISLIPEHYDSNGFVCGSKDLNTYLKTISHQHMAKGMEIEPKHRPHLWEFFNKSLEKCSHICEHI